MDATRTSEPITMKTNPTTVERTSEREFAVTRTFDAPARLVFDAWTKPELLKLWWAPKSMGIPLLSCEADVRVGGTERFCVGHDGCCESPPLVRPRGLGARRLLRKIHRS